MEFDIWIYWLQWTILGSLTRTLGDGGFTNTKSFIKVACKNIAVSAISNSVVVPICLDAGLNINRQKVVMFITGYMGLGFVEFLHLNFKQSVSNLFRRGSSKNG